MIGEQAVVLLLLSILLRNQAVPLKSPDEVRLYINRIFDANKNQHVNQTFAVRRENDSIILNAVDVPDPESTKTVTKRDDADNKDITEINDRKAELSLYGENNRSMNVVIVGGNKHVIDKTPGGGLSIKSSGGW